MGGWTDTHHHIYLTQTKQPPSSYPVSVLLRVGADVLGDLHGAKLGPAHGAEVRVLPRLRVDGLVCGVVIGVGVLGVFELGGQRFFIDRCMHMQT